MIGSAIPYCRRLSNVRRVELEVPFPAGTPVSVFVVEQCPDEFASLTDAASRSFHFWDDPFDDEDWNDI
jgi:hypothetical protein